MTRVSTRMVRLSPTLVAGMDNSVPWGGDLVKDSNERKIYDFLVAPERLGRLFVVPGTVPADRVALLRAAFDAMVVDPEFLAEAKKQSMDVNPLGASSIEQLIAELYATPKQVVDKAAQAMTK